MIQPGLIVQNRYLVVQQLGAGSFGKTFEVNDRGTPKVLKVLNLDNFSSPGEKQKVLSLFQREAHVLMQLNHPGIPRVERDGYFPYSDGIITQHCLVMEKIEGHDLLEWLQKNGNHPITQTKAIDWLKQLALILDKLHGQQYFHRDIKPENIMLKPDGKLVLIDFGAVRKVTPTYLIKLGDEADIREGTEIYSRGYSPVEKMKGKALPQSDFYALGRTFVHLLTGKHPSRLPEDDDTDLIWRDCATQVSKPLADLIDELMAFFPKHRPENSQIILQRLAELELNGATELSVVLPTKLKRIGSPNTRSRWLKPSPKIRNALIGLGITVVATVTVLNFPKLTPPQRQSPAPQPTRSLPSPRQSLAPLANISLLNTFRGHSDFVHAVAFSPDGQTFASGSKDNTIKLLNPRTGKLLKTLSGASSEVWSVAISPDGRLLASGHWQDKTIKLWDLRTGKLLRTLKGHSGEVRSVAFSPDGQILASGSHDKTIKLWRVSTGELLHTFPGHTDKVTSVAFSPDGKTIASASDDKTIKLWGLDSMKLVRTLTGHLGLVLSIAFSPDGETLVSSSGWNPETRIAENSIKLWNPQTGELRGSLTGHGHVNWVWCLAISPDGRYIASGSYDNTIKLWNLRTGELLRTLREHSDRVYSVAFSPNGQTIASGSWDNTVRIWGVAP